MSRAIVIAGPTGVGKTKISINLAKKLNAEIISADSAQIYKGLDVGTAKITEYEKEGIKHHLIDITIPNIKYSVGAYEREVSKILNENEEKVFLIVGGTGLYINSIVNGLSQLPEADERIRASLAKQDINFLYNLLLKHDEEAARAIHISNRRRIERALEVYLLTGEKFSVLSKKNIKNNSFSFLKIALERDRETLYKRINRRVELMFEQGLEKEVRNLYNIYGDKLYDLNIIGYRELISYLKGEIDFERAKYEIKRNSRHYAKRQFTWFRADKEYKWLNLDQISEEEALEQILDLYKKLS